MVQQICPNCKSDNRPGVKFCGRCGSPLTPPQQPGQQLPSTTPYQPPGPPPAAPPPQAAPPTPTPPATTPWYRRPPAIVGLIALVLLCLTGAIAAGLYLVVPQVPELATPAAELGLAFPTATATTTTATPTAAITGSPGITVTPANTTTPADPTPTPAVSETPTLIPLISPTTLSPAGSAVNFFTWEDGNENGLPDPGELPLAGVEVDAFPSCGSRPTDKDGRASCAPPTTAAGAQVVKVPDGYRPTTGVSVVFTIGQPIPADVRFGFIRITAPPSIASPTVPAPTTPSTPASDTPAGSVLQKGDTWKTNGIYMTLRELDFKGNKGFRPCFHLKNQTGGDLTINYDLTSQGMVSITDSQGRFYNYSPGCAICLEHAGAKVVKNGEGWDWCSDSAPVNVWQGPYNEPQVAHLRLVINLGGLVNATWQVPIVH